MRSILMGAVAAAMLAASAAGAATVTFDDLPDEGEQLESFSEDGVLVTASGGALAFFGLPGRAHLDDGGTGFASSLSFSTGGKFSAVALEIAPSSNAYKVCADPDGIEDCSPLSFANVAVTGFADGSTIASDAFDMSAVSGVFTFGAAFAGLDRLVIGFSPPPSAPAGRFVFCFDSPCTHFDLDSVTLAPVPLPASGALLAFALAGLAARVRRKG